MVNKLEGVFAIYLILHHGPDLLQNRLLYHHVHRVERESLYQNRQMIHLGWKNLLLAMVLGS